MPGSAISRILITGGAGFIGSHIAEALIKRGYEVGVLDSLVTGDRANIRGRGLDHLETHKVDVRDYREVRKAVRGYEAIFHHAALVSVTRSVEDPITVNEVNVGGTLNLLKAASDRGVKLFVYASSSSVYGETRELPKREDMEPSPISPYGVSKLAAETYCKIFARVYGLRTVSLRYFNVYGPRQKSGHYSGVIPNFISTIRNNRPPTIYGDGEQSRDFTYVDDVVQANLLCLEKHLRKGEVLNIAAGRPVTINELAGVIISKMGKSRLKPEHRASRAGDIRHSYADISKARTNLGYSPKFTIESGIPRVIEWFTEREGLLT
jgi:nucleoside-diphosphate-sugar epimerase